MNRAASASASATARHGKRKAKGSAEPTAVEPTMDFRLRLDPSHPWYVGPADTVRFGRSGYSSELSAVGAGNCSELPDDPVRDYVDPNNGVISLGGLEQQSMPAEPMAKEPTKDFRLELDPLHQWYVGPADNVRFGRGGHSSELSAAGAGDGSELPDDPVRDSVDPRDRVISLGGLEQQSMPAGEAIGNSSRVKPQGETAAGSSTAHLRMSLDRHFGLATEDTRRERGKGEPKEASAREYEWQAASFSATQFAMEVAAFQRGDVLPPEWLAKDAAGPCEAPAERCECLGRQGVGTADEAKADQGTVEQRKHAEPVETERPNVPDGGLGDSGASNEQSASSKSSWMALPQDHCIAIDGSLSGSGDTAKQSSLSSSWEVA